MSIESQRFHLFAKNLYAFAYRKNGQVIVLKDSLACCDSELAASFPKNLRGYRQLLIVHGILVNDPDSGHLRFTRDWEFESPSRAACIIEGNSRNGRDAFKNVNGNSLNNMSSKVR